MRILRVTSEKKKYLPLLLLADEQESMIDRYLEDGDMYVLLDPDEKCVCVVADNGDGEFEIKNIAVDPDSQGQGLGRMMIEYIKKEYLGRCKRLIVGTGDSPLTLPFYHQCGFRELHRIEDFFTDHYDHPIIEAGTKLKDMVILGFTPDTDGGDLKEGRKGNMHE